VEGSHTPNRSLRTPCVKLPDCPVKQGSLAVFVEGKNQIEEKSHDTLSNVTNSFQVNLCKNCIYIPLWGKVYHESVYYYGVRKGTKKGEGILE